MRRRAYLVLLLPIVVMAADDRDLAQVEGEIAAITKTLDGLPALPPPQAIGRVGFHSSFVASAQAARWVQVDLGESREFDSVALVPASFSPSDHASGVYGMPPRFRVDASDDADFAAYQTLVDHTETDYRADPGPVFLLARMRARYVRFTATRLARQRLGRGFFCLGEVLVFAGPRNIATGCPVSSSGTYETQPTWTLANLTDGVTHLGPPIQASSLRTNGWHSAVAESDDHPKWVQIDLGSSQPLEEVRLHPAHPPDFPERPGFGFPLRFRVETSDDASFSAPRMLFDATAMDFVGPADNPVVIPAHGTRARFVRVTATKLWERSDDYIFALSELEAFSRGRNVAPNAPVSSFDETRSGAWAAGLLVDGHTSLGVLTDWAGWLADLSKRRELMAKLAGLTQERAALMARHQRHWLIAGAMAALVLAGTAAALHVRQRIQQRRSLIALRRQIARDLHDEIGSSLGSISLMSEVAMRDGDAGALQEIHRLAREAADSMRGIVWLVREPGVPSLERLIETMRQTAATLLGQTDWEFLAPQSPAPPVRSLDFHRHVFLFFKEAVHNVARHAGARKVLIQADWTGGSFSLTIQDDGIGFDPSRSTSGSGLDNLRHRAAALCGKLTLDSRPGEGTRVHLEVPLS